MAVLILPPGYVENSLDDAAVDRIVAAVEKSGHKAARAPRGLDRGKLAADLNRYWGHTRMQSTPAALLINARPQKND